MRRNNNNTKLFGITAIFTITTLLLISTVNSQLDFSKPQVLNITLKQNTQGIFCSAQTSSGTWPIYQWHIEDKKQAEKSQLLSSGFKTGDKVTCEVSATTGYDNATSSKSITVVSSAQNQITGAIIGAGTGFGESSSITWLGSGVLLAIAIGLAVLNVRMYKKHRQTARLRKN